ncbi:uncharacterized protein LOC111044345 [Nilaparvata lugens]|uniref:uncharacterized protein LOC111044345 n=1 Tax=Nilaparvata lugens TaxID=108931 RepID=UPI00193D4A48|nr:uncharacterized protein LOC111044345 [Nilaparvata lugens]
MKLGEIVNDSIIENKQKTKCYWEQLMTANSEQTDTNSKKKSISPSTSRDCSILKRFPPSDNAPPKIKSSLIEREIQLQKERELEHQQSRSKFQKPSQNISDSATQPRTPTESPDLLGCSLSLTNTDDGNHSEYGSEDKEDHSLEDGLSIYHHHRTRSLDSMSSGHSSASGSGYGSLGESGARRRQVTVKPLDEPDQVNTSQFLRNAKETPIEREIRLSKEREDELRRSKGEPIIEVKPKEPLVQEKSNKIVLTAERSNSSDQNDSPVERRVPVVFRKESVIVGASRQAPSTKGAIPKIFSPNPKQKGLMKRFIASRGRLSATFIPVQSPQPIQPPEKKDLSLLGVRPGYVSAEDKIQVELKEMRKREEELRKQQMARSQPNLLACFDDEPKILDESKGREKETEVPKMGVLRSALSIPNLLHSEEPNQHTEKSKQAIKRSSMIDVWESMIQKN